jgi:glutamate---cysteine ligase / carboxylate-amine ligase
VSGSAWADWRRGGAPYTVGAEEELMIVGGDRLELTPAGARVVEALPPELARRVSPETHASALEIQTGVHETVAGAAAELEALRATLARELEVLGLRAASAGTHPLALGLDTEVSPHERYQHLHRDLGALARREPTFALHVHTGLPTPEAGLRAYNHLRSQVPLLIGLSANSPFWRGRDSGLGSARTFIFNAFPRTGLPRAFGSYEEYVEALDGLMEAGAIPEPTFVWWDLRLQPALGTLEIRVMDAQPEVADTRSLIALVQCLVREAVEGDARPPPPLPEIVDENHFIAARDGADAALIEGGRRVPLRTVLDGVIARCREHADALGCDAELDAVSALARDSGASRQRRAAAKHGVSGVTATLADAYAAPAVRRPLPRPAPSARR